MKLTISVSASEYGLLEEVSKKDFTNPATSVSAIAGQIIGNWCADRRSEKRFQAAGHHYTERQGSDFEEAIG